MSASSRGRRLSAVWLGAVSVFVVCAGTAAAHTNAPTARTRATAAGGPMCCYTLNISTDEKLVGEYKSESSREFKGFYAFTVAGTAYGLARLSPSGGATQRVLSTEGGVAGGILGEVNEVTFEGEPSGCTPSFPTGRVEHVSFRRTEKPYPVYEPPPGHGDAVGYMNFGEPFFGLAFTARCNWLGEIEHSLFNVLRAKDPQARFLDPLSGGPIFGSGLTVGGLLKGGLRGVGVLPGSIGRRPPR